MNNNNGRSTGLNLLPNGRQRPLFLSNCASSPVKTVKQASNLDGVIIL